MDHGATAAGSGVSAAMISASPIPNPIPIAAPSVLRVAASTRNCDMMSARLAPSAFRTPISRVRSATATSMMFMITIAPTTRLMAGRAVPNSTSRPFNCLMNPNAASCVTRPKSSGSPARRPRSERRAPRAASIPSGRSACVGACTMSDERSRSGRMMRPIGDVYGAMALRSRENPNTDPCFSMTPITVNGTPAIRSCRPSGLSPGKKCSATSVPITMTRAPARTS